MSEQWKQNVKKASTKLFHLLLALKKTFDQNKKSLSQKMNSSNVHFWEFWGRKATITSAILIGQKTVFCRKDLGSSAKEFVCGGHTIHDGLLWARSVWNHNVGNGFCVWSRAIVYVANLAPTLTSLLKWNNTWIKSLSEGSRLIVKGTPSSFNIWGSSNCL